MCVQFVWKINDAVVLSSLNEIGFVTKINGSIGFQYNSIINNSGSNRNRDTSTYKNKADKGEIAMV